MNWKRKKKNKRSVLKDALAGAAAGTVATWVMGKVTSYAYQREDKSARRREDRVRRGTTAYEVAAEKTAALAGRELSKKQRARYGSGIHWGVGIGTGAVYGILRPRMHASGAGWGLLFGTGFWLLLDELTTYALRLTPGPRAFPWQTHARGLAGHLTFGAVADATLRRLQRVA